MPNHIYHPLRAVAVILGFFVVITLAGCSGGTEVGNPEPPVQIALVVTAPVDVTAEATGLETVVDIGTATVMDAVGVTITSDAPATYAVGTTTVTWTATDAAGNSGTATQRVTVQDSIAATAEEELETYLKDQYATSVLSNEAYGYEADVILEPTTIVAEGDVVEVVEMAAIDESVKLDAASGDFSQTNIQEAGVDEADRVKTDGTFMYIADQGKIDIVKVVPPDAMSVISTVDVNGRIGEIYLFNDILVVLFVPDDDAGETGPTPERIGTIEIGMPYWLPINSQAGVMLVDVSDPSDPNTIRTVVVDGLLVSSRLTSGKLHIVQQFLPDLPPLELNCDGTEEDCNAAINANRQSLSDLTLEDLIPSYETYDGNGNLLSSGRFIAPDDFYQPDDPQGGSIVSLMTLNLNDPDQAFQSVGIIADAHLVYASTESLYLGATLWNAEPLSEGPYDQRLQTVIHKFDLAGDRVNHLGSGNVQGKVLNQFSLGEYQGILRIATTTGERWWGNNGLSNHVYCLQATDGSLEIIGKIEGLAPGENLYSARFIGARGFLVTFVRIDPLFTLDLSDPTDPKVVGELKVPGYSDYIHPLGENHLLTVGKDVKLQDGMAWYQGVQLSIFDISDFGDPALLHKEIIGARGTSSQALYNHKAFTFWAENDLLAIPIALYEYENEPDNSWHRGSHTFSGLYVYRTTAESGFEFLGRIDTEPSAMTYPDWTRSVFIDDSVYAIKRNAVRSADIDDIENSVSILSLSD